MSSTCSARPLLSRTLHLQRFPQDPPRRGGEAEPSMSSEIRDPVLRAAFEAAYEGWARTYPHLVEDWSSA